MYQHRIILETGSVHTIIYVGWLGLYVRVMVSYWYVIRVDLQS